MEIQVSVIVPTFNRKEGLRQVLDSLFQQTLPPNHYEIIVVNDGSTDGTAEVLEAIRREHTNLISLQQTNRGPASARNAAARLARGLYLAFTDDDCVVSRDWLQRMVEAFERTQAGGLQGRTSTDRTARTPFTVAMDNETGMWAVPTCNAAYRKDVFELVGGFDENFTFPHNEDADLAWRVEGHARIVFAPELHVVHPPRPLTLWQRARWVRYLSAEFLLHAKHPKAYRERCSASPWVTIYWRVFVIAQLRCLKSGMKYLIRSFEPRCFLEAVALATVRGWNLLRFFPYYYRAARRWSNCRMGASKDSCGSSERQTQGTHC